ncbi:MAG: 5'/3'-nucleotidase SurE [Kiritimatiellae bacterium]|nr:5'/3'-nucleotidase SurE [Kiritimatiellia bacterium]
MQFLLSNDDGIQSDGLRALARAAAPFGGLRVIAPDGQRSATGHAITLSRPLRARPWPDADKPFGTALDGLPADCVKLALSGVLGPIPDAVLTGVNLGPNAGAAVPYSGTCSAAAEAALDRVGAIAFSLDTFTDPRWDTAEAIAGKVLSAFAAGRLPLRPGTFWNVNIPNLPVADIKGFRACTLSRSRFVERYEQRADPWGDPYFWVVGDIVDDETAPDGDLQALREGFVSLSRLTVWNTDADDGWRAAAEALSP